MNRMKRILSLILILVLTVSLTACRKESQHHETVSVETGIEELDNSDVVLPYSREDGVNPFLAESLMNQPLMPLMYDGLYELDDRYEPQPNLAAESGYTDGALVVRLNRDKRFSDGSEVSADDVVYSFEQAKESPYYKNLLADVTTAEAYGNETVVFTVGTQSVFETALLTFPVVKAGSARTEDNIPLGTGRYVYTETENGGTLTHSEQYDASDYSAPQLYLDNMTGSDALLYTLGIGTIDATFDDLSTGEFQRVTASLAQVPLNNLVMVKIRRGGMLGDPTLRKYISDLINRSELISSGLDGYADATNLPVNPNWYFSEGQKTAETDTDKARAALEEAFKDSKCIIVTNEDNPFKLKLAETLADQLLVLGIESEIQALPEAQYKLAVSSTSYDLAIAEYKVTPDMDISSLLDGDLKVKFQEMQLGEATCEDFVKAWDETTPFLVIGFRNGVLAYSRGNEADVRILPGNPYANVYEWSSRQD